MGELDPRCLARAQITPGHWKRCIRAVGHDRPSASGYIEPHVWVEALNRSDGRPVLAVWYGPAERRPLLSAIDVGAGHA